MRTADSDRADGCHGGDVQRADRDVDAEQTEQREQALGDADPGHQTDCRGDKSGHCGFGQYGESNLSTARSNRS